ncbi:hypothetical protein RN001_009267 [Aquatica leii]|uniref:UPAR/Ly6 domain-containing protein n=1 Tax=Aquatica leii TaxID=1421715 RepID=A0AAN7P7G9_9COLE|nr:hypothetical protein RN001_009267 [Aquatica leii]
MVKLNSPAHPQYRSNQKKHKQFVSGLKCYRCTATENDKDKRCITDPASVEENAITDCNKVYCITVRVEYTDPKDKLQSMMRDCVDKPIFLNETIENGPFRVYYRSCRTDLCNGGTGLKCYTCTANENDKDKRCITDPGSVEGNAITECNKVYCTTVRVEYTEIKDKVQSMNRDCVDRPIFQNEIIENGPFRVYYTSCRTDLCNDGTGKDISKGDGIIDEDGQDAVLYVLGIRENSALSLYSSITLIISALCFVIF